MIPIALPSAGFYIFVSLGFLAGLVLLGWALALVASGGARRTVRKYWKTSSLLFVVLVIPFAFYAWVQTVIWQIEREGARREAARNVTLAAATTVGGVAMPAGTRLKLQDEGQLETYVEAEFPRPVAMYGVQALRALQDDPAIRADANAPQQIADALARTSRWDAATRATCCCAARAASRCGAGSAMPLRISNSTWHAMAP